MKFYLVGLVPLIFILFSFHGQSKGLTLDTTRLIYSSSHKEKWVSLMNDDPDIPFLIQSWVADINQKTENIPFITTPPVFKLAQDTDNMVRVIYVGDNNLLPTDRESLFLLNIRAIPAIEKQVHPHRLTISTQNIIKLIYRPSHLTSKEAENAGEKLQVSKGANYILFKNPTPYVVTLTRLIVNNGKINHPGVVMPFAERQIKVTDSTINEISFSTINDFGGTTPKRMLHF